MGEVSWKQLIDIVFLIHGLRKEGKLGSGKAEIVSALEKLPAPASIDDAIAQLSALSGTTGAKAKPKAQSVHGMKAHADRLRRELYGAIDGKTERWDEGREGVRSEIKKCHDKKLSAESVFFKENTVIGRSTWFEKMGELKKGERMPDAKMMLQCAVGLHRTQDEAANLLAMAGYNACVPSSRETGEMQEQAFAVLRRPAYSAKRCNGMIFSTKRNIRDELADVGELLCGALTRLEWMEEREKGAARALREDCEIRKEEALCAHWCGQLFPGQKEHVTDELKRLAAGATTAKIGDRFDGRLLPFLCARLRLTRRKTMQLLEMARCYGISCGDDDDDALKAPCDEAFAAAMADRYNPNATFYPGSEAQRDIYYTLYQQIERYWLWADEQTQGDVEAEIYALEKEYEKQMLAYFLHARGIEKNLAAALIGGDWLPGAQEREKLLAVLNKKEQAVANQRFKAAEDKYKERLLCLIDVCIALRMTEKDTQELLRDAYYGEMTLLRSGTRRVDESFKKNVAAKAQAIMPEFEPEEETAADVLRALWDVKDEAALRRAAAAFDWRADDGAVFGALRRRGLPEGRTLTQELTALYDGDMNADGARTQEEQE